MRLRVAIASLLLLSTAGCGSKSSTSTSTPVVPVSATRSYNGTASVGDFPTITLDSTAHTLTYTNHSNGDAGTVPYTQNNILAQGTLAPVADTSYPYGATGELTDPCFGLFTFRVTTANSQQDVFMTFQGHAVPFSSFQGALTQNQGNTYNYFYGVAVK